MECIAYWIHKRAMITPHRVALISEKDELTYRGLSEKINELAAMFHHHYKLAKGDRVAILSQNRTEYIITYFAVAQLGLIAVPLNIRLTASELAFQIKDSGAKTILYEEAQQKLYSELCRHSIFENAYLFERGTYDWNDTAITTIGAAPREDDAFIICYTSGTTGRPKGAVLTQGNMFWNALNNQYAIDITSYDRTLVLLPLFHIGGIGLFAFPTLLAGGTIIIPKKFDPEQTIQLIETEKVTIVMGVPAIHLAVQQHPLFTTANFSSVRWFYNGGAPCPKELIHHYLERGLPFGQGFGMTETAPTVFMLSKEDFRRKVGSIGKPVLFCDIDIVDEDGKKVKNGEVGELLIKGPNVMKEYWGLPDKTKETIQDGWLFSGDLVRQDAEGFVYIAGRKKEMIISGGENIYPLEVEQIINELAYIREVAVIGVPNQQWGEVPIAFVSLNNGLCSQEEVIQAYCRMKLAKYKVPKQIIFMNELPKNATGKINKQALHQHYTSGVN